jgi:predicted flavoprotein YhiN
MNKRRIIVVGGGAAGFFAAITAAEASPDAQVTLLERGPQFLSKVRISGGGRCNVTHSMFDSREFARRYPRGEQALIGAFKRFQASDTVAWFAARGVKLKVESDGRMFPVTDSSETIVDCLMNAAKSAKVSVRTNCGVESVRKLKMVSQEGTEITEKERFGASEGSIIKPPSGVISISEPLFPPLPPVRQVRDSDSVSRIGQGFELTLTGGEKISCDKLLLATGGCRAAVAGQLASALGHTIESPVPSLFTFHIAVPWLRELAGVSVESAEVSVSGTELRERGPLLVTHWGLSGPVVLRLSAWGARELHERDYKFQLLVNWLPHLSAELLLKEIASRRQGQGAKLVVNAPIAPLTARLWEALVLASGLSRETRWASLTRAQQHQLIQQLSRTDLAVTGKSLNKDEFVTCGGVKLGEVNFKTMESRVCPGLYFAGELLDIDGITGGFNFQAAWTTGWIAGNAM